MVAFPPERTVSSMRSIGPAEPNVLFGLCVPLIVIGLLPFCKISRRIGHSRWWGLLTLVPFVGFLIWSYYVEYAKWPIEETSVGAAKASQ